MVEPLMKTIRRHYQIQKMQKKAEFYKFKKKNYILLLISIFIVMICQGVLPLVLGQDHRIHSMFSNAVDVFSWVILWKPIERLIFYWNPFLKEILLYEKIEKAKVNIVESDEDLLDYHLEHFDAA
jgi:ABC-type multidrug transport system fused ATPase/permease subunit